MANNVISKFKQNIIGDLIDSFDSPIRSVTVLAGGADYANGDNLIFTGEGSPASGKVFVDNDGAVQYIAITNPGNYVLQPNVVVSSLTGIGAAVSAQIDNDHFYMFAARSLPYISDATPEPNYENDYDSHYFMHEQMYFGKKLLSTDIAYMARQTKWESGTVYAEYDDKDKLLPDRSFYVITTANRVYKCIYNNGEQPSTSEPTSIATDGMPVTTADGYRWKYMYKIVGENNTKFTTPRFIPIIRDPDVALGAIPGAIFNVKIQSGGSNYPTNSGVIKSAANGSPQILISDTALSQSNYYAKSTITVFGNNNVVSNRKIVSSGQIGSDVVLTIDGTYNANQISAGHSYSIGPTLSVVGDGVGFDAYCVMNHENLSISRIEIIDGGTGYNQAEITAVAGSDFGSGAKLRPIISPPGGHGADAVEEMYCERCAISGEFSNTVPIPDNVTVRTFGILKNPTYANGHPYTESYYNQTVTIPVSNTTAQAFNLGETVKGLSFGARGQVAFSNSSTLMITGYTGDFNSQELIVGQTSAVIFKATGVPVKPDIKVYSGDVIYIQNVSPAARSTTSSERVKLIIKI